MSCIFLLASCPIGHYCPGATDSPLRCIDGEYQTLTTQTTCDICLAGYYCDNTVNIAVVNSSTLCPEGHYCPAGTKYSNEYPCPIGTFNNLTGIQQESDCTPCLGSYACPVIGMTQMLTTYLCEAGYFCKSGANTTTPNEGVNADVCPVGYYCPQGTVDPEPCPIGTYSNQTGLHAMTDCTDCPAGDYCDSTGLTTTSGPCSPGYYCEIGSHNSTHLTCPAGSYCPERSPAPTQCPAGTYSNTAGTNNVTSCVQCDAGQYCNDTGLTTPVGACDAGFYCPGGDTVPNPTGTPCPIGRYCPTGTGTPIPCVPGTFTNLTQQSACLVCPAGFYCVPEEQALGNSSTGYSLCPEGFYCPEGTGRNWSSCPPGKFSNVQGLDEETDCQSCTGGWYCDVTNLTAPVGQCDPGYFCTSGSDTAQPDGSTNQGVGGICPPGSRCPAGSVIPDECPVGTYQDQSNQADCLTCPAGYYCLNASTDYSDKPCPVGHYCPNGTQYDTQYKCPAGTFNNITTQQDISACLQCLPGYYCDVQGLSSPTGLCDAGWYCTSGSQLAQPTSLEGGQCLAGTYCPQGSSAPTGCDPGMYCATNGLSQPTGNCSAGFYCSANSTTDQPTGLGGDKCNTGTYCVVGSWAPEPCPPGTYNPNVQQDELSDCLNCTAGKYCTSQGLAAVEGDCNQGYYCPQGQIVGNPSAYECPAGYFCVTGSSTFAICPSGTYQDLTRQWTCKTCMEGYYCDNSNGPIVNYTLSVCPSGHYCPNGTQTANQYPCPAGTYNDLTTLTSPADCLPCLGGYYCPQGTVTPTLPCGAGYFCRNSSQSAAPVQGAEADQCPVGHYCPQQTTEPIPCPVGTFSNSVLLMNESQCTPCTQGYYCDSLGLTAPAGLCAAGFYCQTGSTNDSPVVCPAGNYCPTGTHTPSKCPSGTFSNATQLTDSSNCTQCTAGSYCTTTGLTDVEGNCTAGYYCPTGSTTGTAVICPIAFYCPEGSPDPQKCVAGTYTTQTGKYTCDLCPQGYYCLSDNVVAGNANSALYDCPAGFYCPQGTGYDWQACPKGTYSTQTRLYQLTQCTDCDARYYCGLDNATAPTALCSAGYFCQSGVDRPNPDNDATNSTYNASCPLIGGHTGYGDLCPIGSYCPEGTDVPISCPPGTYQDQEGQSYCKGCPEGYYCLTNTTDYSATPCPSGHYCPSNTTTATEYPCGIGTFNPNTGQINSSSCLLCTGGKYCDTTGLSAPAGNCSGGWYCIEGAVQSKPTVSTQGNKCIRGQYCPEGSDGPTYCDGGYYCNGERLPTPSGLCDAGYYCVNGSDWHQPFDGVTGDKCPYGHYCPQGSISGIPCPMGYYLNAKQSTSNSSCTICTAGQYCGSQGLQLPTGDCAAGYYCPSGQSTDTPAAYICPVGHFCLQASTAATACPSGQYQNLQGQSSCISCPEGYYCDSGTYGPIVNYTQYVCPEGSYCPVGTQLADQYPCPLGTYNNITGLVHQDNCTACVGGMACDETGLTYPKRPCSAGYFCLSSADSTTPTLGASLADVCPTGSYCPVQTADPVPCPIGTYNDQTGLQAESQCTNCTGGSYCNSSGLSAVVGPCFAGFYCPVGSDSPTKEQCIVGNYCPVGSENPTPCPIGSFSNNPGNAAVSDCTNCSAGYYCQTAGLTNVTGACSEGYYCPTGSSVDTQVICPIGKKCPAGSAAPVDCEPGTYSGATGQVNCTQCPAGSYCVAANVVEGDISTVTTACPAGYYCPAGTGYDWQPCPAGTFSTSLSLTQESECTACTGGYYCSLTNLTGPSGMCGAGFYCTSGAATFNPTMLNSQQCPNGTVHPIIGDVCPIGHYCPTGTSNPIGCPAGTYQDLPNQDHCKGCPAGYFCLANTTDYTPNDCPSGHYCPDNTTDSMQYPCPPQTFNNLTNGQDANACISCLPGMYCAGSGNVYPTGNCSAGFYCTNGSDSATPTIQGGRCLAGTYCPAGATAPYNCTLGQYCSQDELAAPEGNCTMGYYCPGRATSPIEIPCPTGHYCPEGTGNPIACSNGTYAPTTLLKSETECTPCDGGFYCNGSGLSATSGPCDAGFYCPAGQSQPNPYDYRCTPGHFCVANSAVQTICENGEYQNDYQQSSCKTCEPGYYCDNANGPIGNLSNYECPTGYYCPAGVNRSNEYPCPSGTYNNRTMLVSQSDCQPCLPGYYCQNTGLSVPEGLCYGGYYCNGSTIEPNPSYAVCPIGNYCPEGSSEPTPCPSGTIAIGVGNSNLTDCEPCKPGNYCTSQSSQNGFSLPCDAGYICLTGSDIATPTDNVIGYICPVGYYCPSGAIQEIACPRGYYSPTVGAANCTICPFGTSCPDVAMNDTQPCPAGYYCVDGTVDNGTPCPVGTYNPLLSQNTTDSCLNCSAGSYCETTGLSAPTNTCTAGYQCLTGAQTATPDDGTNGPCPIGHYCDQGTTAAVPCPRGTIRNSTHGAGIADCYPCTGGKYCDTTAAITYAGICGAGYYCPSSADIDDPQPTVYQCPTGHYCLADTADPIPCAPGTYQPSLQQTSCVTCPKGYYCPQNTTTPVDCPAYSYCPDGSASPVLCHNGTYTDPSVRNLENYTDCTACPAGKYCTGGNISDDCQAGFICYSGIGVSTPDSTQMPNGGPCPYGFYCPQGITTPQTCPSSFFIDKEGAASAAECVPCPGGRICPDNSTVSEPCWAGYYCPVGEDPIMCPNKTYNNITGASDASFCLPCPGGYYCDEMALTMYELKPCPLGYYCVNATDTPEPCPTGTYRDTLSAASVADCTPCPGGRYCPDMNMTFDGYPCVDGQYCPEGADIIRQCKAGYYCNNSATQLSCPPAYYCPANSTEPTACPSGSYCTGNYFDTCNCTDAGAIEPTMCPPGYGEKVGADHITLSGTCDPCRAGTYSASDGSGCIPCRAGVVCLAYATTDNPVTNSSSLADTFGVNATQSYLCPPGYYCPEGSGYEIGCPAGTYRAEVEGTSLASCTSCPVDNFNHITGQTGCFHCGGAAFQPAQGQVTCTCTGQGRDFQESDRTCPCQAGFIPADATSGDCTQEVYPNCADDEYRYQDGSCFTTADFVQHCTDNVCDVGEYSGQVEQYATCLCSPDDLESICDLQCRKGSEKVIEFVCAGAPVEPYLRISSTNGTILHEYVASSLTAIINSENTFTTAQCDVNDGTAYTVSMTAMDETNGGFLGVYAPDENSLIALLNFNVKDNITGNASADSDTSYWTSRRRLLATATFNGTTFSGIKNPIACLEHGSFMLWAVNNNNYPIYDINNLMNTNSQFDYGGFRKLAEAQAQLSTSTTLFSYQFNDPGTYVFHSSSNIYKKMYVSVMQPNTQCTSTGPFFPVTPLNLVANGVGISQEVLQEPDWPVIFVLLGSGVCVIVLMILALFLFRKYGWMKNSYLYPFYRLVASKYDFDNYASKGSTVYPVRKYHRNMHAIQAGAFPPLPAPPPVVQDDTQERTDDDFWDYNRQVDLEGFSSRRVYDTLSKQSRNVTVTLGQQKDEVKQMYNKVSGQTDSLKSLWAAKMNLKGMNVMLTEQDMEAYNRTLSDLERELERRKEVGHRFMTILARQEHLATEDEKYREEHQVNYQASLREAHRTLKDYSERLQRGQMVDASGQFDYEAQRLMESRVSSLLQKMSSGVTDESARLGCWGVIGQGTGAQLLSENTPATREEIFGGSSALVHTDKSTGLLRAKPTAKMLLADGRVAPVPEDNFVHPHTGHVLPVQGNVAYDPITSRLVLLVDSASGEAPRSADPFIPFVPYPTKNGQPIRTKLHPLQHASDLKYGAPMSDAETSLHVPIMGVTVHPQTGAILPIGGTHVDIVTGLSTPIEVGSLMMDPTSGLPVPVLAVTLDPDSGDVVPVGGVHANNAAIIAGETFEEPLSNKKVKVLGGYIKDTEVEPSAGGYQGLLDSRVLACEANVNDAVKEYMDTLKGMTDESQSLTQEQAALDKAINELENSRTKMKVHLLRSQQDIKRRQERAQILATTGGSPGMYEFSKTGQLLPILVGTEMADPAGSGQVVPILGAERSRETGKVVPLGGTMEDPEGAGLVPISIGKTAIDPVTGELSPVIGARLHPENQNVVAVTLSSAAHRKKNPPPGALATLEEEITNRRNYWRHQRQREERVTSVEHSLTLSLIQDIDSVTVRTVSQALEEIDSGANDLNEACKKEFQRRGAAEQEYSNMLPPEVVAVLTDCDSREAEMEDGHISAHVKFADTVRKFFTKLQQEEKNFKEKLDQVQGSGSADAENITTKRYRNAKQRLLADLQGHIITRVEKLDEAHSALEYARQRSELSCQEAKVVLTHSALLAGDYDAQLTGVYGDADSSAPEDSELVPLLKQLIALLEAGGPFYLSSELLKMINSAAGGRDIHNVHKYSIGGDGANGQGQGHGSRHGGKDNKVPKPDIAVATLVTSGQMDNDDKKKRKKDKDNKGKQSQSTAGQTGGDEASWKEFTRRLFERQAYEAAKLENDLKSDEITAMQDILDEYERKKKFMMGEAREDLRQKLEKCDNEAERDRIMQNYAMNLQKVNDAFDKQKHQQLESLRSKLLEARRNRKKELYRKQCAEAESHGVGVDSVPDVNLPSYDELMKDLMRLQEDQEKTLAEMQVEGEKARQDVRISDTDPEFEKTVNGMDIDQTLKNEMIRLARERNSSLQNQIDTLKEQLRNRKDRHRPAKLSDEEKQALSEEEQRRLMEARELQSDADRDREELALLEARKLMEKEQQRLEQEAALKDMMRNMKEEERDKILAQFHSEMDKLMSRQENLKQEQRDKIVSKLAARKRMREELDKEQAVAKELDRITKKHVSQGDQDAADIIMDINEKVNGDNLTKEQQQLLDDQVKATEQLEERQHETQRDANKQFDEEMAAEELALEMQIQEQKRLAIGEHKNKFDRDMLLNKQNMSEDEYKRKLAEFQREMSALSENMEKEKDRQRRVIKDRILERRKKRDLELEEKHRLEMEEEMSRQQQQRDKLNDEIARKVENEELKKNVKNIDGEKAENLIYTVLRQRHLKEAIHLEDQLAREMAAALRRAKAEEELKRQKDRDQLMQAFEQEMIDLVANSKGMSEEELEERKKALKRDQKRQRKEFDKLTEQLAEQAERDIKPKMETEQTYKRLELKEKQLGELSDAMKTYSPSEELKKKYAEEARLAALEAQRFRDDILKRMQEELERKKREEREKEEEKQRKMAEHYKRLEKDLQEEHEREAQRLKEREAEKQRLKQKQLDERRKHQEEEIQKSNMSEEEKQRLLREHTMNMEKLQENLLEEQTRAKASLNAKLAARKKKREGSEFAKLNKQMQLETDQDNKNLLAQRQQEASLMGSDNKTETSDVVIGELEGGVKKPTSVGSASSSSKSSLGVQLTGNVEQDWMNMLMASPLFQQINDLEDMLEKSSNESEPSHVHIKGADYSHPYIDVKDAQWACQGDLSTMDLDKVSASQYVVYRFGVFVIKLLHDQIGTPNVTLLLASNLPPNNYERNAFRNSMYYEHARNILFVRRERLDSIGEFVVLILHAMSHIKAGEMTDDSNAVFLRQFYKCLKVVCQDMFFSRTKQSSVAQSLTGAGGSRHGLEQALAPLTKKSDDKTNVVGELIEMKVDQPVANQYSSQKLGQRMYGYDKMNSNARLRQYLASKGGYLASSDFISSRMAELRGSTPRTARASVPKRMAPPMKTPRDVVDVQLVDLQSKNDVLNEELADVLKNEAGLREGIRQMEHDPSKKDTVQTLRDQLEKQLLRKTNLLNDISNVEGDIVKKEKELKSKR